MKNRRLLYKNNDIAIFFKNKKYYLSVKLNEDDLFFQKYFFENYYKPTKNFLLRFIMVKDNKLLFEFPNDFNFIDYTFKTKYDFLSDKCRLKRIVFNDKNLEYDFNNFIIKEIIELKQYNQLEKNEFEKIKNKFNFSAANETKKFYSNVVSDLIFNKLLIHKKKNKFFFLDYSVFSFSKSLQIENSKKINYCEL